MRCLPLLLGLMIVGANLEAHEPTGPHHWTGKASLGFSQDWGNTEATDTAVHLHVRRDTSEDKKLLYQYLLDGGFKYKQKNGDIANNEGFLSGAFRRYFSEKWSWRILQKINYDAVKDLDFASNTTLGMGYWLWHSEESGLNVDLGLGYAVKRYKVGTDSEEYFAGNLGAALHQKLTEWLELRNSLEAVFSLEEFDQFTVDNVTVLHASFDEHWGMESSFHVDFDNAPASGKKNLDLTLQLAVTYSF